MNRYNVAVIGGGPAGSFTALLLASEGLRVCLVERKMFPRETLCGEFLSYEVSNFLKDAGLFEKFLDLSPNKITSFGLFTAGGGSLKTDLKFTAFGLRRSVFDNFLLDEARNRGVKIYMPFTVTHIKKNNSGFILSADSTGEGVEIEADYVVNASGKRSTVDKILSRSFSESDSPYNGVKIHLNKELLKDFDPSEIHIYSGKDIYCGVNKVEGDQVTLCFLEKRRRNDPSVREKFLSLKKENTFFGGLVKEEADLLIKNAKVYGTGSIYFGKKEIVKDDVYMVGDSAGVIAPLAGDGMGMAMESARLLAEILTGRLRGNGSGQESRELYIKEWNRKFRRRLVTAGIIQKAIFSVLLEPGLKLLKMYPRSINTLIDYTRK